jgi:acetyl/propionyl-CoA carboxylase alpha subunit
VYGKDRELSLRILKRAFDEYRIGPVPTTLDFGRIICENRNFIQGNYTTSFIEEEFMPLISSRKNTKNPDIAAALATFIYSQYRSDKGKINADPGFSSAWRRNRG